MSVIFGDESSTGVLDAEELIVSLALVVCSEDSESEVDDSDEDECAGDGLDDEGSRSEG